MQSYTPSSGIDTEWQRIAPLLDEAMEALSEKDRDAVVLRFFEQLPLNEVAPKLGVSEDGAQKRVGRALEKLRGFFVRRGRTVSIAAMTGLLLNQSVQAAPASIVSFVCAAVVGSSAPTSSFVAELQESTIHTIAQVGRRLFAVRAGSIAILVFLTALVAVKFSEHTRHDASGVEAGFVLAPSLETPSTGSGIPDAPSDPAVPMECTLLLLRVVDGETTAPVANAQLTLVSTIGSSQTTIRQFLTDPNGFARVIYSTIPVKSWSHRIEVFRDGYVPRYLSWSEHQQDRMEEIPASYILKLEPAVTIGGGVVDEQDLPVRGARVVFSVSGPTPSRARERRTMMGNYHTEITGVDGRWTCSHVPARFGQIEFKPVHPLFQEELWVPDSPDAPNYVNVSKIPEADFLTGRATMRLKAGLAIVGVVTDESGRPVEGARVTQNYEFKLAERSLLTPADGSFEFRNGRAGGLTLTVQSANLAPVVTSLVFNASLENLRVTLPAARLLRGVVVDEEEAPVVGAVIEPMSPSNDSRTLFQWRSTTDIEGRFGWDAAPAVQEYTVYSKGFETQRQLKLTADGLEQTIRLMRSVAPSAALILGRVFDVNTKQPPPSVRVQLWETRKEPGGGLSTFTTLPEDAGPDGQFRIKTSAGTLRYVLEVQAPAYWPQRITNEVTGTRDVTLQFGLEKAPVIAGLVLTPMGEPAAGATLVVCGHHESAFLATPGRLVIDSFAGNQVSAVADLQGRFRLPSKRDSEVVVVAHSGGFVEVPFSHMTSNTVISLQAWGRIEGTVRVGSKPMAEEGVRLSSLSWRAYRSPRASVYLGATTDADGRFVFTAVPPGEWNVMRELKPAGPGRIGMRIPAHSHGAPVIVQSGETSTVIVGGEGRTVVGRMVAGTAVEADLWAENFVTLILKTSASGAPVPPKMKDFSTGEHFETANQAYLERADAYWNSSLGMYQQRLQREYSAMFVADGSFRIDAVPPGDYLLKVTLSAPPKLSEGNPPNFKPIASLETDVSVPVDSSPSDDTLVNLGTLHLLPAPTAAGPHSR